MAHSTSLPTSNKTILLVEDDVTLARILGSKLEMAGHQVNQARTGTEALSALKTAVPDLVILDLLLPEYSGLEVLEQIRTGLNLPDLPVIVLTVLPEEAAYIKARELGAVDYIIKTERTPEQICILVNLILKEEDEKHDEENTQKKPNKTGS